MVGTTGPAGGGGGATNAGFTKGETVSVGIAAGEWWGQQDPRAVGAVGAVLQARGIGPCAQGGGQRRLVPRQ